MKYIVALLLMIILAGCVQKVQVTNKNNVEVNHFGFLIGAPEEAELIKESGAGWARPHPGPFAWGYIEKNKGTFDFSETDRWVRGVQKYGIAILATVWPYADWDQKDCHSSKCEAPQIDQFYPRDFNGDSIPISRCIPCNFNDYKNFIRLLVERYDGDGVKDMPGLKIPITYWEILNEPEMQNNNLNFFFGNEEEYVEILKNSYVAIKDVCPECAVVHGGAAGAGNKTWRFWKSVFEKGGANYFDIANIHIINYGDKETLNVEPFKKLMNEQNITKPIWVTEALIEPEKILESSVEGAFNSGASRVFFVGIPNHNHWAFINKYETAKQKK